VAADESARIKITKDGPYYVTGNVPLTREAIIVDADGESESWLEVEQLPEKASCGLCRCGQSNTKPYCDGSHLDADFNGTETAERTTYDDASDFIEGPVVDLMDDPALCAEARFCHRSGAVWNRVAEDSEEAADVVVHGSTLCPSGRYTAVDRVTGERFEPHFEPSIALVDDPHAGCAGPLWVRGGVPIESADGTTYEPRNRVTLCRCGQSKNKPFCDGSHVEVKFQDERHGAG